LSRPQLKLYNTKSKSIEDFKPINFPEVGLYTCGPTVYSYAHIGNMRQYIFADTLRRTLNFFDYKLNHVMNITDVGHLTNDSDDGDDKMEIAAAKSGITIWDVAKKYTDAFFNHAEKLNIQRPETVCKATDYINEQIAMVKTLEEKGFTYKTADGIYFDTDKFPQYADFAKLDVEGLQEGHRIEAGGKRKKTDFALWKFSADGEKRQMEWESPWGRGFPGWHIECSAMATKFLGENFDIHTGGVDHVNIHHTNEVAQSECAHGKPWVNLWMHGEFLVVGDSDKMSKSEGATLTIDTLEENGFDARAYRLLCLQSHYRKQLKFTDENMGAASKFFERIQNQCASLISESEAEKSITDKMKPWVEKLDQCMANDLNTCQALANLSGVLENKDLSASEKIALINHHDIILGLEPFEIRESKNEIPPEMQALLERRLKARADKEWSEADKLRDEILAKGYEILDTPEGSSLKLKH
jgi:cysteinyl-tRNA synthetase